MGIFDKSNYIVNTGVIEQFFQCTNKMILLAKMIKLWTGKEGEGIGEERKGKRMEKEKEERKGKE